MSSTDRSERIVEAIDGVLVAVPSLGTARKAWQRLGFACEEDTTLDGVGVFRVRLAAGDLVFAAPSRSRAATRSTTALAAAVEDRLEHGAGAFGWTWAAVDPLVSHGRVQAAATAWAERHRLGPNPAQAPAVPLRATPGAFTMMVAAAPGTRQAPSGAVRGCEAGDAIHPNHAIATDHTVLMATDVDRTADVYEECFGLSARRQTARGQRYAFLKIGPSVLEIVGPVEPEPSPLTGRIWGVALRSDDLDATVACLDEHGIKLTPPHEAVQGGRIASLPMSLAGLQIAFLGD
jgi:predicted enzyme related to lactoylglutathione lyase